MRMMQFVPFMALLASGCNSTFFYTGNLAVATVPCILLYLTLNLKRERQ